MLSYYLVIAIHKLGKTQAHAKPESIYIQTEISTLGFTRTT
jgi:hypothetical protein